MAESASSFETGDGGGTFETQVQISFAVLMLTGGFSPCFPHLPIQKIKLQGRHADYHTDDMVCFVGMDGTPDPTRLLAQIKYRAPITADSKTFRTIIRSAWQDFNDPRVFTHARDKIALVTGPLPASDSRDTCQLLDTARQSSTHEDFLDRIELAQHSNATKRNKLRAFRQQLNSVAQSPVNDATLFRFLKHYHLLAFDLDLHFGVTQALFHTLLQGRSRREPAAVWGMLSHEIRFASKYSGILTREYLEDKLNDTFVAPGTRAIHQPLAYPAPASPKRSDDLGDTLMIANLLGSWEENVADISAIDQMTEGRYSQWRAHMISALNSQQWPIRYFDRTWKITGRGDFWLAFGHRLLEQELGRFRELAVTVLSESRIDSEDWISRSRASDERRYSSYLREGISDSLALLGTNSAALTNCRPDYARSIAHATVRRVLQGADWRRWSSIDRLLPTLAEASPDAFLRAVESSLIASPCPFDELFRREALPPMGRMLMTGLLWAMESLAWDQDYFPRVALILARLAEKDPGGTWANRPINSLIAILLPWHPQTTASQAQREATIRHIVKDSPITGWTLLMKLIPGATQTTSETYRPRWRTDITKEASSTPTRKEYWEEIDAIAQIALEQAQKRTERLATLIKQLNHLPRSATNNILRHLESGALTHATDDERFEIWRSLTSLIRKHRRYAYTKWALPEDELQKIESAANAIAPASTEVRHRALFTKDDFSLYESNDDFRAEQTKLDAKRRGAVEDIIAIAGIHGLLDFSKTVEAPHTVGFFVGTMVDQGEDSIVLPSVMHASDAALADFANGFILGRFATRHWDWVDAINRSDWAISDRAAFFFRLPFTGETWKRVSDDLGQDEGMYWREVPVRYYEMKEDEIEDGADRLIDYGRGDSAVNCLAALAHQKQPVDPDLAYRALLLAASSDEPPDEASVYDYAALITALQSDKNTDKDSLEQIEWLYSSILNEHNDAAPVYVTQRLADDPEYFCEVVRLMYRSSNEARSRRPATEERRRAASAAFRILHEWKTPPGMDGDRSFDPAALPHWIYAVVEKSKETGHLDVALHRAGEVLIHCPPDPNGLWVHHDVAEVLDQLEMEELRRGYYLGAYNSRGMHRVDPTGAPELQLGQRYRDRAEALREAGFYRFAQTLMDLAETYEADARRIVGEHEFENRDEDAVSDQSDPEPPDGDDNDHFSGPDDE